LLDQAREHQFGGFKRRETLTARKAFATTANLIALGNQTGIDDFGVVGTAEGTVHGGRQQK
jgi:hypothetical protein